MGSAIWEHMPSAIWETFSEFLVFWKLFDEPLGE